MENVNLSVEDLLKIAKEAFPPSEGSEVLEGAKEEIERAISSIDHRRAFRINRKGDT